MACPMNRELNVDLVNAPKIKWGLVEGSVRRLGSVKINGDIAKVSINVQIGVDQKICVYTEVDL